MYDGDLHAKRVLSLANATLGVLVSASLAIHAVGRGLAQAMGTLTKHGVKQVDRLLSNRGIDVWTFFEYWTPLLTVRRLRTPASMPTLVPVGSSGSGACSHTRSTLQPRARRTMRMLRGLAAGSGLLARRRMVGRPLTRTTVLPSTVRTWFRPTSLISIVV